MPLTEAVLKSKDRPPAGMIKVDDEWQVRRHGLLAQRQLTCIYGHKVRPGVVRAFEIAISCDSAGDAFRFDTPLEFRCKAQLYVFNTRQRMIWAMDVTPDESELIDRESLSSDEIIAYFGVGFPVDHKILRKPAA